MRYFANTLDYLHIQTNVSRYVTITNAMHLYFSSRRYLSLIMEVKVNFMEN